LLGDRAADVRAAGIDFQGSRAGNHHQVHVFHRNRPDEDLIAHHQRPGKADAILEADLDRADVGDLPDRPIGQRDFLFRDGFQLQSSADLLGNAQVQRSGIRQGVDLDRPQFGQTRISQQYASAHEPHDKSPSPLSGTSTRKCCSRMTPIQRELGCAYAAAYGRLQRRRIVRVGIVAGE